VKEYKAGRGRIYGWNVEEFDLVILSEAKNLCSFAASKEAAEVVCAAQHKQRKLRVHPRKSVAKKWPFTVP
jgi:hypothetical protein